MKTGTLLMDRCWYRCYLSRGPRSRKGLQPLSSSKATLSVVHEQCALGSISFSKTERTFNPKRMTITQKVLLNYRCSLLGK